MNEETKKAAEIAAREYSLDSVDTCHYVDFLAGVRWHASHAAKEVAMVDEALKECVAALYGARACLGDIANISHAIKLAEDALVKNALSKLTEQSAKAGEIVGKDE